MQRASESPIDYLSVDGPNDGSVGVECCEGMVRGETVGHMPPLKGHEFRDFSVNKLNYGYVVKVGCHTFAIEDKKKLIRLIGDYITDPNTMEENWWKTKTL